MVRKIPAAWRSGVRLLLFLVSSFIYSKFAEQPIREKAPLTGALEPMIEWYAIAKITGIKLCEALRRQPGFAAINLMPTNLYGSGDNYHPTNSHALPALIRRFHEAAEANAPRVARWGTGTPLRKFLHLNDPGEACVFVLEQWQPGPDDPQSLNVGTGVDPKIRELAEAVSAATRYEGEILWDNAKPDSTPKMQMDVSRVAAFVWPARIPWAEGLTDTIRLFREQLVRL
jgi:GDP-L-fucose synthase